MANHILTTHAMHPGVSAFVAPVLARVKQLAAAIANRRAVYRLCEYDERMLKDIGLTQGDVDAALDYPMSEDPSLHLRDVAAGRGRRRSVW